MKQNIILLVIVGTLSGCASFPSEGPLNRSLVNGDILVNQQIVPEQEKSLTRASKMVQAGALIEATLYTPGYRKLKLLSEARRTRETEEYILEKFKEIESTTDANRICFLTYFEHASIDLAKPDRWKLKVSINGGGWQELSPISKDVIPDYIIRGASRYIGTDWYSSNMFCGDAKDWANARLISLNAFPPVFVNPGEAMLEWAIN